MEISAKKLSGLVRKKRAHHDFSLASFKVSATVLSLTNKSSNKKYYKFQEQHVEKSINKNHEHTRHSHVRPTFTIAYHSTRIAHSSPALKPFIRTLLTHVVCIPYTQNFRAILTHIQSTYYSPSSRNCTHVDHMSQYVNMVMVESINQPINR